MVAAKCVSRRGTLVYPSHQFNPEDWMDFIEMKPFARVWEKLGFTDKDLLAVQLAIMADPRGSPVIPGTGGLRKIRFSPERLNKGKSGALRVCYVLLEEHKKVALALAYPKGCKDDISDDEKKLIKKAIDQMKSELS